METVGVDFTSLLAPAFQRFHRDVISSRDTDPNSPTYGKEVREFFLRGGRGSTKSSAVSLEIVRHMLENPMSNAVVFMKVADNIRNSVYNQICWAIDHLELNAFFKCSVSPISCVYSPSQDFSPNSPDRQEIMFRGLDKAGKVKGIKPRRGYFDQIWFEELTEFNGMEDVRSVIQSVLRGGDEDGSIGENVRTWEYYSYNPPPTLSNWVNSEAAKNIEGRKIYESNYLTVPERWLGKNFIKRALNLKKDNPRAYAHEYLGWITGTGNNVFNNIVVRSITDDEINKTFNNRCFGIDWGFAGDPFVWLGMNYDRNHRRLLIFDEIVKLGMRTQMTAELVKKHMAQVGGSLPVYCDCAEPDSIADYNHWGVKAIGCPKPHGQKWSGRDYEFQALQDLDEIVVDPKYCPYTVKELTTLEFPRTPSGETRHEYPHSDVVDACVSAETIVITPDGATKIENLVGKDGKILSFTDRNTFRFEDFCYCRKTRENAEIVMIELEDGSFIKCTSDHRILTENRGWVQAENLTIEDMVVCR